MNLYLKKEITEEQIQERLENGSLKSLIDMYSSPERYEQ